MILKDVAFEDLQTVVKFMYHGIVNVSSDKLPSVLRVRATARNYPSPSPQVVRLTQLVNLLNFGKHIFNNLSLLCLKITLFP